MTTGSPMITFDDVFGATPVMAIFRGVGAGRAVELAERAWDLGIVCVEVPVQSPETVAALAAVVAAGAGRDVVVGAGTVTTAERVRQAADAGARFTVAPGFDHQVAAASVDAGLAHLPGVATASEIQAAARAG